MFENVEKFAETVERVKNLVKQWEDTLDRCGQLTDEQNVVYLRLRKKLAEYNIILLAGRKLQLLTKLHELEVLVINQPVPNRIHLVSSVLPAFMYLSDIFKNVGLAGCVEDLEEYQEKIATFEREHPELQK